MFYALIALGAVLYGVAAFVVIKQGGEYSVQRGGSYKKGMIFPAFIMAIPVIAVIGLQML